MGRTVKRVLTKSKERDLQLDEAMLDYIEEKKALNKSEATIRSARDSINKFIAYHEAIAVKDVDSGYVYSFCNHFLNEGMKPTTLNHYIRDIRAFLYWCMEKKLFGEFKIKLVKEQEVIKETYSDEELGRLLARPAKNAPFVDWRTWAIVNWVLATGNRAATVCSVRLSDINFKKREININKTKTNKAMIIPLSPALQTALNDYIRKWRSEADDDGFLFPNIGEEELTVNALRLSLHRYNRSRDVEKTSIHALRHTFAKNWIRNTGDVFRLQKLLGHSSLEMTRRYVNMFSEDLKEGFETYNPLDKLKKSVSRTNKMSAKEQIAV